MKGHWGGDCLVALMKDGLGEMAILPTIAVDTALPVSTGLTQRRAWGIDALRDQRIGEAHECRVLKARTHGGTISGMAKVVGATRGIEQPCG